MGPAPTASPPPPGRRPALGAEGQGTLVLTNEVAAGATLAVFRADGERLGAFALAPGQSLALQVPAGEYVVQDSSGGAFTAAVAPQQQRRVVAGPAGLRGEALVGPAPGVLVQVGEPPRPPSNWRRPVAPILSAMIPGLGQMVNREYARGAGFLLGALSLGAGSFVLWRTQGGLDAAAPGEHGRTFSTDVVSATGFGLLTGGLHLLYMAQVMDAYAGATGKRSPRPHTRHKLSLELTRMASVGLRAGDPAAAFYPDWNISVLGQVARRFSVGLTDIGAKFGPTRGAVQGGPRLHVRFLERDRVWLGAAAGAIFQGAFASGPSAAVPEGEVSPRTGAFALIPYGQLDLRLFILDRWSINIVPRISAPLLGARYYRQDGAIPKQAATLELGTGLGVYF